MVLPRLMGSLVFPMLSAPRFTLPRHLGTHGPPEAFFFVEALLGLFEALFWRIFEALLGLFGQS